jgi:prephenate dehydrogenase
MDIDEFQKLDVAIIGLGLMGASLAMALRGKCQHIIGIDLDETVCSFALENGMVDFAYSSIDNIISTADIIILATPIRAMLEIISRLPDLHNGNPIVMDLGSTKMDILMAFQSLPERFDVIGGHPVCGKETLSIQNADKHLYKDQPFIFSPLDRTSIAAIEMVNVVCDLIGANPHIISHKNHDLAFATTSHMPFLVSTALLLSTPNAYKPMIGPGFRSMVRIANTPSSMMLDVLDTNSENIVDAIDEFQNELSKLKKIILAGDNEKVKSVIDNSRKKYLDLIS